MERIVELLIITGVFILVTVGFGYLFALVNRQNSKLIQHNFGWKGICFFGMIGVPVHEGSHLIMAVLFGHKIKKVALFRPRKGKVDGVLGFVQHTYKPKLFQKMGNFFIGAAPMIVGALLLRGLLYMQTGAKRLPVLAFNGWQDAYRYARETTMQVWSIFTDAHIRQVSFWLVLFCMIGIAVNMNMSTADAKNSMHGILSLFVVTAVVPVLLHLITKITYETMTAVYVGVLIQYVSILFYALVICGLIMGIMYLIDCFV